MESTPNRSATHTYRPDIDGLRAIAVLLVLFSHVDVKHFTGGFVGVDVFFVISGYLISSLILKEIEAGNFSVARFYERRFRRIVPALLAVLAFTSFLCYYFLFPLEQKSFAQSELGALFSCSNVVFWQQTSYFDAIGKLKPLLHTWSLGVEEQFYLIFPLFLLALCRWGRRHRNAVVWLLTISSFLLACYFTIKMPTAAFFLAPLRAWELLLGTLLALHALPGLRRVWQRNLACVCGLLLILAAANHYRETTPFPGLTALVPCLGTVLILAAGESGTSVPGKFLAWTPLRCVGLISYSLYLWHWPILVFQKTNNILVPDRYPLWVAQCTVIVVSLLAGALSWRFIEQPFRTNGPGAGGILSRRLPLFALNGALFLALFWYSNLMVEHGGWPPYPWLRSASFHDLERTSDPGFDAMRWDTCYVEPANFTARFQPSKCLAEIPGKKQYLLLGDSHAAALYGGLQRIFPELNISQINATGCKPLITDETWRFLDCRTVRDYTFYQYLSHHHVDTVLLEARWQTTDLDALTQTIQWIQQHGMKVIVIGPAFEFDRPLVRLIEVAHRENDPMMLNRHQKSGQRDIDQQMSARAHDIWNVPYISMFQDLCGPQAKQPYDTETSSGCPVYGAPNVSLMWDTDHLGSVGAMRFAQAIRDRKQLP